MRIAYLVISVGICYIKCFCKSVTEIVRSTTLKSYTVVHHRLNGIGFERTRKFFLFGLSTGNRRNCKSFTIEILIALEHTESFLSCSLLIFMHSMSLLPQKLRRTEEWTSCFLPSYNVTPLIVKLRKITIRMNYILVMLTEKCFRGRTNSQTLGKSVLTAKCYPCTFRRKAFNVILFSLQKTFGNKHRHIQKRIPFGSDSISVRMVAPVVVKPEAVSKRASI